MKESKIVTSFMTEVPRHLIGAHVWKICDRMTGGLPDVEIAWSFQTTKIEFKVMKPSEWLHDKWEDGRQLQTCEDYEQQTGRCWVLLFTQPDRHRDSVHRDGVTEIFRPSALRNQKVPVAKEYWMRQEWLDGKRSLVALCEQGAIRCEGNVVNEALISLIIATHRKQP